MDVQMDVQKIDGMGQIVTDKREEPLKALASPKQHSPSSLNNRQSKGPSPSTLPSSPPSRDVRSSTASAKRSTPLAPMIPHQASISANATSISSATSAYGGSDVSTGGPLGLGLKDVQTSYTAPLNIKKRSSTAPASAKWSQPGSPVNSSQQGTSMQQTSFAALFPDFAVPELSDSGLNILDHQGLLSPFMLASPNFTIPSSSRLAASPSGTMSLPSTPHLNNHGKSIQGTPRTAPRQHFFQTGSASSMPRFPTPDKLALGYTPSPQQFPSNRLLPPLSPAVPLNTDNSDKLTRSVSAGTITSESTLESFASSPSSSNLSDVLNTGLEEAVAPLPHTRNASRDGKARREDIRESLLHFPSPPTSPRQFNFSNNHLDTSLPYAVPSLSSSKCSSAATPALSSDLSSEDHSTDDDNRPSLDEIMHAQANAAAQDDEQGTKQRENSTTSFAPLILPELSSFNLNMHQERTNSISLPPTSSLPALPRSASAHASAPAHSPPPPTRPVPALPLASPAALVRSASAFAGPVQPPPFEPQANSIAEATSADLPAPSRPRFLKSSKSTESLLGRKLRGENTKQPQPSPLQMATSTFPAGEDTEDKVSKVAGRRRRASLSIKIPKFLAKLRKNDELSAPNLPPTPLNCPESRFSPDSEGPPSAVRKPSLAQRLSRAVSSPNLKSSASMQDLSSEKDSVFVPPASAPPVPSSFLSPLPLPTASFDSPLPTPGLLTDFGSSAASGSPRLTDVTMKQPQVPCQSTFNPYFFAVGGISSYLIPSSNDTGIPQSPRSHADMQWLEGQPKAIPVQPSQTAKQPVQESSGSSGSASPSSSESDNPSATATGPSSNGNKGLASSQSSSGSQDDEDDDEKERYGKSGTSSDGSDEYGDSESEEESENDDVPLAQAHPDALQAQKSLRLKEKEARKKVRTTKSGEPKVKNATSAKASTTMPHPSQPASASVSRSATTRDPATRQDRPVPRKQNTMPIPARNPFGFAPDELSKKLKGADLGPSRATSIKAEQKRPDSGGSRPHALLLPQTDEQVKRRNKSKGRSDLAPPLAPFVQDSVLTMSEGSDDDDDVPLQANMSLRSNSSAKQPSNGITSLKAASSIRAQPIQRVGSTSPTSETAPTTLAQSVGPAELAHMNKPAYNCQQRIYINDPQHHSTFTIDEKTTPATILAELRAKGAISANPAYCVIEMWRTLGVERPLREYEFLQDSIESWSNDVNASLFLVKKTSLAPLLTQAAQPTPNSEEAGGWVHMEVKRGKWSKRWMEIRNNSVFIGKSEKPRDQTLLCTLSNFDAYQVPQACIVKLKTPKPFAFALKSVDKVTLFENADQDYVHFFSVKTEAERDQWTQRILQTRSSLVQQILTARAAALTVDTRTNIIAQPMTTQLSNTSSNLSRASSRHQSPPMPSSAVFADGSLLARAASTSSRQSGATSPTTANPPPIPPVPSLSSGNYQSIPQGRDWEKLGHDDRHRHILEAAKKAREGGQPLLDFSQQQSQLQAQQMSRAKSLGQRR